VLGTPGAAVCRPAQVAPQQQQGTLLHCWWSGGPCPLVCCAQGSEVCQWPQGLEGSRPALRCCAWCSCGAWGWRQALLLLLLHHQHLMLKSRGSCGVWQGLGSKTAQHRTQCLSREEWSLFLHVHDAEQTCICLSP
jgi:hypothetical protein